MHRSPPAIALLKVTYRPIEAAIRWCGLTRHETHILQALAGRQIPEPAEFPQWPRLRLNVERIYDGIVNKELPVAIDGIVADSVSLDDPKLAIRHVDLKAWMNRVYPGEKPRFLFGRIERAVSMPVSIETTYALLIEREALRARLAQREKDQDLRTKTQSASRRRSTGGDGGLSGRAESTYLNIIGAFLTLLLGSSPGGQPYSPFRSQEAIIDMLVAQNGGQLGITERTLQAKFAAAKRSLGQ